MANSLSFTSVCSFNTCNKPGIIIDNSFPRKVLVVNEVFKSSRSARMCSLEAKAAEKNQSTKPTSIVCADCEGNGAKQCSQCKGTGVNSVDHFNGQFKAGGLCWLCSCRNWHILGSKESTKVIQGYRQWGKREILCGNCNGAGFIGGFMSTLDD